MHGMVAMGAAIFMFRQVGPYLTSSSFLTAYDIQGVIHALKENPQKYLQVGMMLNNAKYKVNITPHLLLVIQTPRKA